jgi:hypothetical protein
VSGIVIHRSKHAQQFVIVPNRIARDRRLSFRARGLLVMLLSLPAEWHITTDMLAEDNPESRTAIRAAMAELRDAGYVEVHNEQDSGGRWRKRIEVFDTTSTERGQGAFGATRENTASSQVAPNAPTPVSVRPGETRVSAGRTERVQGALNRSTGIKNQRRPRSGERAAGCSTDHPGPLSESCRQNDGPLCVWSWCLCSCHGAQAATA